jgi:hypothetical protein
VFRAVAAGRQLQFENAGLVGGNEIFKDSETGSRWQQSSLEAISGPLQGKHLALFPFLLTDWREWHRLHPDTLVLKPLPGYAERIAAKNEQIRQSLSGEGPAPEGVLRNDGRLKPRTMILGLDVHGDSKAFPLPVLRDLRVINDHLGGETVLIVHQPGSDTTTAFLSRLKAQTLTFTAANSEATDLIDRETHSHWDAYGRCISGRLRGSRLRSLILEPEYWFAWSEFHPSTAIYAAPASHN